MAIQTTCIGAYPKPDYVPIRDWFQVGLGSDGYSDQVIGGWQDDYDTSVEGSTSGPRRATSASTALVDFTAARVRAESLRTSGEGWPTAPMR